MHTQPIQPLNQQTDSSTGAGIGQETSSQNRTDWGLDGGAVRWNSSHEYAVTYINLGLGEVVKSFNISLLKAYNGTGAGQQCFSKLGQTALTKLNLTDGQPASIQVITTSSSGASLFNVSRPSYSSQRER
jgi:hypothetical protein